MKSTLIVIIVSMIMCALPLVAGTPDPNPSTGKEDSPVAVLWPSTPHKGPKAPASVHIDVYGADGMLIFGISETMGVCSVYFGEMESPMEMFSITSRNPGISVSDIEAGIHQLTLVTEGNQIFQGTISL